MATAVSPLANIIPPFLMNSGLNPWAEGHEMMKFPKKPFHTIIKDLEK
jgi:L-lactate dehydrogenase complex protein LldF